MLDSLPGRRRNKPMPERFWNRLETENAQKLPARQGFSSARNNPVAFGAELEMPDALAKDDTRSVIERKDCRGLSRRRRIGFWSPRPSAGVLNWLEHSSLCQ
jgi:hypothetical protein